MGMKLRRRVAIDGPRGIVLESGGDEFSGRLRGMDIADPRLRVPLKFLKRCADTLAMGFPHAVIAANERGERYRLRRGKRGVPPGTMLGAGHFPAVHLVFQKLPKEWTSRVTVQPEANPRVRDRCLCTGKAKLSTSSREGKTIITKVSEPGDVLGLNATISNCPYEVTAEMVEPGQANFMTRDALLQFLRENGEVAVRVAEQLSRNYYAAYEEIRTLGLTNSPSEKFAKLLLGWSNATGNGNPLQVKLTLTHEEIAEMIGTTRETVSRLFSEFKKRQLVQLKGATLVIRNKAALEKMVNY